MAKMREIRGRLKAVANIKRITKTMQMIATSKFQAAARRALATKPYNAKIAELVGNLSQAAGGGSLTHPLLEAPAEATGRRLVLVLTSDRGLCGGYNGNILRTAGQFIREHGGHDAIDLEVVGRKGVGFFRFTNQPVEAVHDFGDEPTYRDVAQLAKQYMDRYAGGDYDAVHVIYMQFITNARQTPTVSKLLPLDQPDADESVEATGEVTYDFSPEPAELLAELLPITVTTQLYQCFNDAVVSEHVARMVAMKAATDNADDMGKSLRRVFNRARQTQITTELNEVVSGAEALG